LRKLLVFDPWSCGLKRTARHAAKMVAGRPTLEATGRGFLQSGSAGLDANRRTACGPPSGWCITRSRLPTRAGSVLGPMAEIGNSEPPSICFALLYWGRAAIYLFLGSCRKSFWRTELSSAGMFRRGCVELRSCRVLAQNYSSSVPRRSKRTSISAY
jgi:hypothetical protein